MTAHGPELILTACEKHSSLPASPLQHKSGTPCAVSHPAGQGPQRNSGPHAPTLPQFEALIPHPPLKQQNKHPKAAATKPAPAHPGSAVRVSRRAGRDPAGARPRSAPPTGERRRRIPAVAARSPPPAVVLDPVRQRGASRSRRPALAPGRPTDGAAVFGLYTQGGTVVTVGTTDWAHGLRGGDGVVERITRNILDRLSQ